MRIGLIVVILWSIPMTFTVIALDGGSMGSIDDMPHPQHIFEVTGEIIQHENSFIVPSNASLVISNPQTRTKIILPQGTDVINVSSSEVDVVYEDFKIERLNITEITKIFIPFNYGSVVNGTQNFTLKIYFNKLFSYYDLDEFYSTYEIDWGDNFWTAGNQGLPYMLSHRYKQPGTYNITISLIDKDGVRYSLSRDQTFDITTAQYISFWSKENKDPLTIGTSSMLAMFFFVGLAYTETGRYKLLALLTIAFPMLATNEKEDVLDQFVRGQIYGYIKTNPGTHYNEIMRELDIKNGTLSYHLYVLEKTGIIKSRMEHMRYRAFYPTEMKFPEEERYRLTDLQMKIMELIQSNKGTSQKQIAKQLDETHQTISYNIKVLEQSGLISVVKKGRKNHCYIRNDILSNPYVPHHENSMN